MKPLRKANVMSELITATVKSTAPTTSASPAARPGQPTAAGSSGESRASNRGEGGVRATGPGGVMGEWVAPRKLLRDDWCPEAVVAEALGLDHDLVSEERDGLMEGTDFRSAGTVIELSEAGVWHLLVNLGLAVKNAAGCLLLVDLRPEPIGPKKAAPGTIEQGRFIKVINPRRILVAARGEMMIVGVRDVRNFRPGMEVPLCFVGENPIFAGRLPRYPGKY